MYRFTSSYVTPDLVSMSWPHLLAKDLSRSSRPTATLMHGFDSVKPILHRSGDKNSQPTDQAFSHLRWHASRLETVTVSTVSELRHLKFLSNLQGRARLFKHLASMLTATAERPTQIPKVHKGACLVGTLPIGILGSVAALGVRRRHAPRPAPRNKSLRPLRSSWFPCRRCWRSRRPGRLSRRSSPPRRPARKSSGNPSRRARARQRRHCP